MLSGISIWQLLILLVIVVMIFGTKRLKGLGGDLGSAIKDFRSAMHHGEKEQDDKNAADTDGAQDGHQARVIDQDPDDNVRKSEDSASHDRTS